MFRQLLDMLGPKQREALVLRLEGSHTYDEFGRRVGIRPNATRMRVARALDDMATLRTQDADPDPKPPRP